MQTDINNFLRLGYYLDYDSDFIIQPTKTLLTDLSDINILINQARSILMNSIEIFLKKNKTSDIIVPLSGGFDSRLILACLLEFFESKKIKTYTFGTPKTYDYEIGNLIAEKLKTEHTRIDLNSLSMTMDNILYNNKVINNQCLLFYSTPFHHIDKIYGEKTLHFSGFMGDPLAGSKLKNCPTIESAIDLFINDNTITNLSPSINKEFIKIEKTNLSNYENIDFHNRQSKYIKPHVAPNNRYYCPFLSQDFINLMFGLESKYRNNCTMYRELCFNTYPNLFELPMKDFHGLTVNNSQPEIWLKRILNYFLTNLNKYNLVNYIDKRTNYFDLKYNISKNDLFSKVFTELYMLASKELSKLGILSNVESENTLKYGKNTNDLVIIASVGAQILSGKSW